MKEKISLESIEALWFPGRWVGGISLIIGPVFLLTGVLLRSQFDFFFPYQLAAYSEHPTLLFLSYSFFIAGNILLWPGVITLCKLISIKKYGWAEWGGVFAIFGLFARTFHAGIDHMAFQLARFKDVSSAIDIVSKSYGSFHIFHSLSPLIMFGWIILAIGAYLSRVLGILRSVALGLMAALPLGVLKGTTPFSIIATIGLCVALIPLGVKVLKDGSKPSRRKVIVWSILMIVIIILLFIIGELG